MPLQGALKIAIIPRAMPWARSFCPFRAFLNHMQNFNLIIKESISLKKRASRNKRRLSHKKKHFFAEKYNIMRENTLIKEKKVIFLFSPIKPFRIFGVK